jgi:hypothetical protein
VDGNHTEVVDELLAMGCLVQSLAGMGGGVPDLLVCTPKGNLLLLEVKDGSKPPSKRRRTLDQVDWHRRWGRAPVHVVLSGEDACSRVLELDNAA